MTKQALKTCKNGHEFRKSSDCPVCPVCEKARKPASGFLSQLASPARRALENKGINSLQKLSQYTEHELLELHGMGPGSIPKLKQALASADKSFKS